MALPPPCAPGHPRDNPSQRNPALRQEPDLDTIPSLFLDVSRRALWKTASSTQPPGPTPRQRPWVCFFRILLLSPPPTATSSPGALRPPLPRPANRSPVNFPGPQSYAQATITLSESNGTEIKASEASTQNGSLGEGTARKSGKRRLGLTPRHIMIVSGNAQPAQHLPAIGQAP